MYVFNIMQIKKTYSTYAYYVYYINIIVMLVRYSFVYWVQISFNKLKPN